MELQGFKKKKKKALPLGGAFLVYEERWGIKTKKPDIVRLSFEWYRRESNQ